MFTHGSAWRQVAEVAFDVTSPAVLAVVGYFLFRWFWIGRFRCGGFRFRRFGLDCERDLGSGDAQPDDGGTTHWNTLHPLAIYEDSIAAAQVAHPPLVILEKHFGVRAAHIFVLNAYFAIFDTPDSKWF